MKIKGIRIKLRSNVATVHGVCVIDWMCIEQKLSGFGFDAFLDENKWLENLFVNEMRYS